MLQLATTTPATPQFYHSSAAHLCRTAFTDARAELVPPKIPRYQGYPKNVPHPRILVENHLKEHGATKRGSLLAILGLREEQIRWVVEQLRDQICSEQIGKGATRTTLYWLKGMPPPIEMRSNTYKVYDFFVRNPWAKVIDIPDDLMPRRAAHTYACDLESSGRLESRRVGKFKEYRKAA